MSMLSSAGPFLPHAHRYKNNPTIRFKRGKGAQASLNKQKVPYDLNQE